MSKFRPLEIPGAWEISPDTYGVDGRSFLDVCRFDELPQHVGAGFQPAQLVIAVSERGVLRGVHYSSGQAKLATCVFGEVLDVVVDLRVGSSTFGQWCGVTLDDVSRSAVYIADGLGHAYCAMSPSATMVYLLSPGYDATLEREVHPLDPDIGVAWPRVDHVLSERDANAPSLAQALAAGRLPGGGRP